MITLLLLSFLLAFIASALLMRWARDHTKNYNVSKPQRFHFGATPRLGGLGVLVGMLAAWVFAASNSSGHASLNAQLSWPVAIGWIVAVLPAVLGGAYEDVTQRLAVRFRLGLTILSAGLACWLLGLSVARLDLPGVDAVLMSLPWLGVALAVLAICGLPHAFNIIDGYNGLAGTVAVMIGLALAHVALQQGDRQLAASVLCMVGATAGFLVWNYPRGLIFAGDGGAYLWGVVIAIASITLVQRHETVSPWFPMLLLMYPVWETVFSIYRKLARGTSPGIADALHFHQLIYRRIVSKVFHNDESKRLLLRNNRTSPYLWGFTVLTVVPAILFWNNRNVLIIFCLIFMGTYCVAYFSLVRFKSRFWLLKRKK